MDEVADGVRDGVVVRRATAGDAEALSGLAFAAKGYWDYPARWMESWREDLTISPGFVRSNEVHVAVAGGEPVGFYALVGEGRRLELEHLWVRPGRIGTGLGRLLFGHAMRRAAGLGAGVVGIESDPNAEPFYLRMGARRVGEEVYELDGRERAAGYGRGASLGAGAPLVSGGDGGRRRRGWRRRGG